MPGGFRRRAGMYVRVRDFARTLLEYLPKRASVLDVGCGEGQLTQLLREAGCRVTPLDPKQRAPFEVTQQTFEEFDAPAHSFDCIATQLVLHHAEDLDTFLDKAQRLLRADGLFAVDDYGWERAGGEVSDDWRAQRSDLHTSEHMLAALAQRFIQIHYADHAYFDDGAAQDRLAFTFIGRSRNR